MKHINDYIVESSGTTIINKIKKGFENWGDNVQIVSSKHRIYSAYYVYVYDIESEEELRKVDDVLKSAIEKYPGMSDDKLKEKFKEIKDQVKELENATGVDKYLKDRPVILLGFTSKDLK